MHLFENICNWIRKSLILIVIMIGIPVCMASDTAMSFKWRFEPDTTLKYLIDQKAQIQRFRTDPNQEYPVKSPIHEEFTLGHATFDALADGNAYGELMLQLTDIRESGKSIDVPAKQKIPQKVCRFVMTPDGEMEQYSGPQKETYVMIRLIFGLPVHELKLNQVRVYPFKVYTGNDETKSPIIGQISHEFKAIEDIDGIPFAKILTTIDLADKSPGNTIKKAEWKGTGESLFNIASSQLETSKWQLALKKELNPTDEESPNLIIEIFDISIKKESTKGSAKK